MKTYLLTLHFLATSLHTFALGTMLLRQPTISNEHIAFVYLIPAEGGQPERLTWHPSADQVTGWTPDGEFILFPPVVKERCPPKNQKFLRSVRKAACPKRFPFRVP